MQFLRGFLFCLLSFVAFFFMGGYISKLLGAAEGQGLASGAIVFMYGLVAGLVGIVAAVIVLRHASASLVTKLNVGLSLLALVLLFFINQRMRERQEEEQLRQENKETKPLVPVPSAVNYMEQAQPKISGEALGLGSFSPDFYGRRVLYFYPFPEKGKSLTDHQPYDSLVFAQTEMDHFEISHAPPYLVPMHLKLDYDMLHFRVKRMAKDHLEIVVNEKTGRSAIVDKFSGKLTFWPEFILSAHAVALKESFHQPFRVKPMAHASAITFEQPYSQLRPESVEGHWLEVTLLGDKLQEHGRAWIQWRDEQQLLIDYALLS